MNLDILGISKLKRTRMSEFNIHDHYINYCRQESLRRNGVAIMVNKRVQNAVLGCNLKNDRMISVRFQGKPFNFTVIHMPQSVTLKKLMLNGSMKTYKMFQNYHPPKRCPFNSRELECKSRKSRNTWSNRQIFPWNEE